MNLRRTGIIYLVVVALLSSVVTYNLTMLRYQNLFSMSRTEMSEMEDFFTVYRYALEEYVDDVPRSQLLEGAMVGLLEVIDDPYTTYLTERQYQRILQETGGSFGGVGIYVGIRDNKIVIIAPIEGTPGAAAGLMRGDHILSVVGNETESMNLDDIVDLMRGQVGTTVELAILREGEENPREFSIRRALIAIESVRFRVIDEVYGYISVTEFNRSTGTDFEEALNELLSLGIQGLVIDLRDNPGGVLSDSIELAEFLVEPGPIVHIVERSGIRDTQTSQTPGIGIPLVLLINDGSASASEIVAGAVKDREAGILLGTKTFGKASVQAIFSLSNGGGFKMTTDRYLTPNGAQIHGVGIEPDIWVYQLADRDLNPGDDGKDVLKLAGILQDLNYLDGEATDTYDETVMVAVREYQRRKGQTVDGVAARRVIYEIINEWSSAFPQQELQDDQLEKALSILKNP